MEGLLEAASDALAWDAEREEVMSAVALRCGAEGKSGDRRWARTSLIGELARLVPLKSYGACANNAPWPEGHSKDKAHVTRRSRSPSPTPPQVSVDGGGERAGGAGAAGAGSALRSRTAWTLTT